MADLPETVVLVPGVGFGGSEFSVLAAHLRKRGYRVAVFRHQPWRGSSAAKARDLNAFVSAQSTPASVHLVAHSMGGLVTLQMLRDFSPPNIGRVVLLGTPLQGCLAARRVRRFPGGRALLGEALLAACEDAAVPFPAGYEIGCIAGRLNFLLGLFLCPKRQNDTLVCVEETHHPDLTAHRLVPASHTSLLLFPQVAAEVVTFLQCGSFSAAR